MPSLELTPFILGYPGIAHRFAEACPLDGAVVVDVFDPAQLSFYQLLNAGNRRAFGELSMPSWVQLDCCTVPTAMIGFAMSRNMLPHGLWEHLVLNVGVLFGAETALELHDYDGLVPVSEYCALPSASPGTVVGFSHFSLVPSVGLGVRTKALALACYRAQKQIGLTQYDNFAVRSHSAFGPLEILEPRAPAHPRPETTFMYEVDISDAVHLKALIEHGRSPHDAPFAAEFQIPVESGIATRVAELKSKGRIWIVAPGLARTGERLQLFLSRQAR